LHKFSSSFFSCGLDLSQKLGVKPVFLRVSQRSTVFSRFCGLDLTKCGCAYRRKAANAPAKFLNIFFFTSNGSNLLAFGPVGVDKLNAAGAQSNFGEKTLS